VYRKGGWWLSEFPLKFFRSKTGKKQFQSATRQNTRIRQQTFTKNDRQNQQPGVMVKN